MAANRTSRAGRLEHLRRDPVLAPLVQAQYLNRMPKAPDLSLYLYRTIINQQLSTRVGDVIYGRFLALFGNAAPSAEAILAMPPEQLRGVGLSGAKTAYIRNVAQFHQEEGLSQRRFSKMDDDTAVEYLTRIKGIGRWTAHIFLIAALGREDVFPIDDLILQKTIVSLYDMGNSDRKELLLEMTRLAENWRPYRSYASRCLWRWDGA